MNAHSVDVIQGSICVDDLMVFTMRHTMIAIPNMFHLHIVDNVANM